jgi:hypothetical protein
MQFKLALGFIPDSLYIAVQLQMEYSKELVCYNMLFNILDEQ